MEIHTFITCFTAVTLLTLTSGVDTILVIRNSGRGGNLLTTWAFGLLKLMGAAYLIWLGLTNLKELFRQQHQKDPLASVKEKNINYYKSFREGFFLNILNPKAIIFHMAFLPRFIDPSQPPLIQSLFIAGLHFIPDSAWHKTVGRKPESVNVPWL